LDAAAGGDLKSMPTPLNIITKPLQIGAQIALGIVQGVQQGIQGLIGGESGEEPPRARAKPEPEASAPPPKRPAKPKQLDDVTITRKVETVLFRSDAVEKGKIDINTADGVVWLRGEAKTPEQIKALEAKALAIPEVRRVENLLHLPKTPAPPKTRRTKSTAAARKRAPKRTTSERKAPATVAAEPSPSELAGKGEGRQPAPLGASETGSSETTTSE
jgi:hypothetical protein